jgi:hypothetical protein
VPGQRHLIINLPIKYLDLEQRVSQSAKPFQPTIRIIGFPLLDSIATIPTSLNCFDDPD